MIRSQFSCLSLGAHNDIWGGIGTDCDQLVANRDRNFIRSRPRFHADSHSISTSIFRLLSSLVFALNDFFFLRLSEEKRLPPLQKTMMEKVKNLDLGGAKRQDNFTGTTKGESYDQSTCHENNEISIEKKCRRSRGFRQK